MIQNQEKQQTTETEPWIMEMESSEYELLTIPYNTQENERQD